MTTILELSPSFGGALSDGGEAVFNGVWPASAAARQLASERGHRYLLPGAGSFPRAEIEEHVREADALILAPAQMPQPDGELAGLLLARQLHELIGEDRSDLHVVVLSHFLVAHGREHRNAKQSTWALRDLESEFRSGGNRWTIIRATWASTLEDKVYETIVTQDPHADGLVSYGGLADAAITSIEHPEAAAGKTFAVYGAARIDGAHLPSLAEQIASLEPDFEATPVAALNAAS